MSRVAKAAQRLGHFIQAFAEEYFVVFLVDFTEGQMATVQIVEPVAPLLSAYLAYPKIYGEFLDYYCNKFVPAAERGRVKELLDKHEIQRNLKDRGRYVVDFHHCYQKKDCPAQVSIIDVSDEQDGSICLAAFRLAEDISLQQCALKIQNNMTKTLIRDYSEIFYIDLAADSFIILQSKREEDKDSYYCEHGDLSWTESAERFINRMVREEDRSVMLEMTKPPYMMERLSREEGYSFLYHVVSKEEPECFEMRVLRVKDEGEGNYVIMTVRNVDEITRDEMSYQEDMEAASEELMYALEKEKVYQMELSHALKSAEMANQAKTDFLSRMSHDIRTPMNAIIGLTAIAGAHINDLDKVKDCLEKISASSRHLLGIINDILDMSRIESGKVQIHETDFELSDMLMDVLEMVKPQLRERKHDLKVYVHDIRHEKVIGDCNRIQQAFVNILGNAVKYTPEGGHIVVSVEEKPSAGKKIGTFVFSFKDDGIGMTEEFCQRIFEPFEREEDLRTSKIQGTGLGMAITKNIVQLMGGRIGVESEYGKGSCFTITLPLKLQDAEFMGGKELAGLWVLVADDDQASGESICQGLDEIGMKSEWVISGQEALERVVARHEKQDDYFAVILDWKMPGMDGLETLHRIREETGPDLPKIILSAYDWSDIELDVRATGANAFIDKPIFKSSLLNIFHSMVHPEKAQEELENNLSSLEKFDFSSKRILLVDDNELNLEITKEIIGTTNVKIETAANGEEAVRQFSEHPDYYYDMILMDVQMPILNGYEATKKIRRMDRKDAEIIPVIAMTANTFEEDIFEARQAGMNEHVGKPIDLKKLEEIMKRWLIPSGKGNE